MLREPRISLAAKSTWCGSEGHTKRKAGDRTLLFAGGSESSAFGQRRPKETWESSSEATCRNGHQGNPRGISNYQNFQSCWDTVEMRGLASPNTSFADPILLHKNVSLIFHRLGFDFPLKKKKRERSYKGEVNYSPGCNLLKS